MKKWYLLNEKTEFVLSSEIIARNPGFLVFLLIINGWGESGKVILQVSIAVLSKKNFRQRWLNPLEKIDPYAYGYTVGLNSSASPCAPNVMIRKTESGADPTFAEGRQGGPWRLQSAGL